LLNLLSGLDTRCWRHSLGGRSASAGSARGISRDGIQSFYLIPELNAEQNVLMAARIGESGRGGIERARELLGRVGLGDAPHLRAAFRRRAATRGRGAR
jgi:putative ABC transport system ATP-binding protein/lipoprotein-releasing system ATP-binding protein